MDNGMSDSPESLNLPKPQKQSVGGEHLSETPDVSPSGSEASATVPEMASAPPSPAPSAPQQQMQASSQMPPTPPQTTGQQGGTASVAGDDLSAEDSDLIEKEWVTKAKKIVDQTRTDPHQQNSQINRVKADYIKKRYNKDIKVSDN